MKYVNLTITILFLTFNLSAQQPERFTKSQETAQVYFVRKTISGFAINFKYFDGAKYIGEFAGQGYFVYNCQPGLHLFWVNSENRSFLEIYLEPGKNYYIEVGVSTGYFTARAYLNPLSDNERRVEKLQKYINKNEEVSFSDYSLSNETEAYKPYIMESLDKYWKKKGYPTKDKTYINIPDEFLNGIEIAPPEIEGRNSINTNVIGILGRLAPDGVYRNNLFYERVLSKQFSLGIELEQGRYDFGTQETGIIREIETQITGYGFSLEGRYYFKSQYRCAPRGLFIGAYGEYFSLNQTYDTLNFTSSALQRVVDENHSATGVGLCFGIKTGRKNFAFEPLIGYAVHTSTGFSQSDFIDPFFSYGSGDTWELFLRIEAKLGVVF